ncbi:MAG: hypothetical protein ABI036_10210 [Fibrobacteria bacterium]
MSKIATGNAIVTMDSGLSLPAGAKELGRFQDRVWGAAPWAEILAPANAAVKWDLAYLEDSAFLAGTQGLTTAEIYEVMKKRSAEKDQFLPTMADELGNEAGHLGAWELAAAADPRAADAAEWKRRGELAMKIQRESYFTGRSIEHKLEDISRMLGIRSRLESLEGELAARPDCHSACLVYLQTRDGLRVATQTSMAKVATSLGAKDFGDGKVFDYYTRVVYYQTPHPVVQSRISSHELDAEYLPVGLLVALTPSELKKHVRVFPPVVIFLNSSEWMRTDRLLTKAQRLPLIEGLKNAGGPSAAAYLEEIILSRLEFLGLLGRFLEEPPSALAEKDKAILESVNAEELKTAGIMVGWQKGLPDSGLDRKWIGGVATRFKVLRHFAEKGGVEETADLAKQASVLADSMERIP